ncbi:uncharacterized protein LOC116255467 isoform X2 [Nymphaea colorata]|nr:uncharacterized protein LOC116255467 isoform X2 [Nymphaea colorata]
MDDFVKLGGSGCSIPVEVGRGSAAIILTVSGYKHAYDLLFGAGGITEGLPNDAVIILRSDIAPENIEKLQKHLKEAGFNFLVNALLLKGISQELWGRVLVCISGRFEAIEMARSILDSMAAKVYIFEGGVGTVSKIKMVNLLLEGIHLVAAAEALFLGSRAGINSWVLYDILSNAAGSSRIFVNRVPQMIKGHFDEHRSLNSLIQDLGFVCDMAKSLIFPLPLLSAAHEQLIYGSLCGYGEQPDATLVKAWENATGISVAASIEAHASEDLRCQTVTSLDAIKKVGFIGLGAMGFGMATHLLKSNFCVYGYDVYEPTLARYKAAGGLVSRSPAEAANDVDILIVMVTNEKQAESVLFGEAGSVAALPFGASIILSSTVSPEFMKKLEGRLYDEQKDLKLVDAPVSGGVLRAATGTLTIMAAGSEEALRSTSLVLSAMSEKLYVIEGGAGAASSVKMVNQLLAGVHIAAAAEAMAFAAGLGLRTRTLFDVIMHGGSSSWMFENRVPHMLDDDYTPYSAVDIFVKDLGIVLHESRRFNIPLHVSAVALQQFLSASASGWGKRDDASVVKVYENLTGVSVDGKLPILNKEEALNSLPSEWPRDPIEEIELLECKKVAQVLVVLDDDPTGTQTVHDVDVLIEWSVESLSLQFNKKPSCFFILTNSRSLNSEKATLLIKDICTNIDRAAKTVGNIEYTVVLRGDSTLRGHFPEEVDAAVSVLGEMDAWIICPFFLQGGRYTIEDVHYVADGDRLVPAGQTEFSKDASFGYRSSNMCQWVEEKTKGRIPASNVASISIELLRKGGPQAVCDRLCSLNKGSTCIVNAVSERDIAVFAAGMIQAGMKGKRFLCRTAASFVSARIGMKPKALINPKALGISSRNGALIVIGSYVPKTTKQVEALQLQCGHFLNIIEVSVDKIATKSSKERDEEISRASEMVDAFLKTQKDTLLMTSRQLVTGNSPDECLEINFKVSLALVEIVQKINTRPRYILAKGGITSSDIASKALGARHAKVVGQALAGVPVWQLGSESRHPDVPYIVFPGNVGDHNALADLVKSWASVRSFSTKDILLCAEKGNYAIGAFNVYNLEGIEAVVAAAEEAKSPAILQIHPSALQYGGLPLVTCSICAANQAQVPITVHFDHGCLKEELLGALEMGFNSVMVDGSHLPFEDNVSFTKYISSLGHSKQVLVEAELGRLSGTEDDITVEEYKSMLTDPTQAQKFIDETSIGALAVCIGNVHGKYPASGPNLRLDLLKDLQSIAMEKGVFLVLHGASGLPEELIKECIKLGVRKFNVNTEVRNAYLDSLKSPKKDLIHQMTAAKEAMKAVVMEKMRIFGSSGKAPW